MAIASLSRHSLSPPMTQSLADLTIPLSLTRYFGRNCIIFHSSGVRSQNYPDEAS